MGKLTDKWPGRFDSPSLPPHKDHL